MALGKIISGNIQLLRKKAALSQRELAERTGLSIRYISGLENEEMNLTIETLERVANGLGCAPSLLLKEDVSPREVSERVQARSEQALKSLESDIKEAVKRFRKSLR